MKKLAFLILIAFSTHCFAVHHRYSSLLKKLIAHSSKSIQYTYLMSEKIEKMHTHEVALTIGTLVAIVIITAMLRRIFWIKLFASSAAIAGFISFYYF